MECGSIQVPADYRDPGAGSIKIAVMVHRATAPEKRIGYLFINPGGPGGSGLEYAFAASQGKFSDEIVERFDILGFDPRGVGLTDDLVAGLDKIGLDTSVFGGGSGPDFACGGPGEQLALLAAIDGGIDTPDEIAAGEAAANLCIESMGPVGALLGSEYVAKDMDEIRKALGAEQVSYYGVSYGSSVGAWYATLFPESVRAMVVDGAWNPVEQATTQQERVDGKVEEQLAKETVLEKALTACADPECPIYNDGDPVGYFSEAVTKLGLVNAAFDNHPLAGYYGVISTLYNEEKWPDLWQGLFELNENDDPSILRKSAEFQFQDRDPTAARFPDHVICLDKWSLHPELDRSARVDDVALVDAAIKERLSLRGAMRSYSSLVDACPFYDQFAPEPLEGPLDGSDVPILVIGNQSDPATTFSESEELVNETLSNGYLLETSHYKHGVYPQNQCVNSHVHRALIDGELPSARRVFCEEDRTFAPGPKAEPEPAATGERIDWVKCGTGRECGSIAVPADYRDPDAGSIRIAVNVHRATSPDERIGYLLVNPGGPGDSGVDLVAKARKGYFSDEIVEHFDIVGFDPRGVETAPKMVAAYKNAGIDPRVAGWGSEIEFACGGLGEQLALLASIDMPINTPKEIAAGEAAANLCIQSMGRVGGLLHSEYVAHDMDEIRKALGAEQVSYLGFSYGSDLGVWYATLFPDSVRAMAVDGARNPFPTNPDQPERAPEPEELTRGDATGLAVFEARLAAALAACAGPECPIYNDGDPVDYFKQAAAKIDLVNAASGNHPHAGFYGVYRTVRSEDDWPMLWQGLFELYENDDPAILLKYARKERYIRALGAGFNDHVNCLDEWAVEPENDRAARLEQEAKAFADESRGEEKYPLLWSIPAPTLPEACTFYDQFAPEPVAGPFDGGGLPILVVGNHNDPATSFSESEEVATDVLSNGYLVETSHYKHVVYPQNPCVNNHVHRALIDGKLPSARRVFCEEDRTFAPTPTAAPELAAAGEQIDWSDCGPMQCGSIKVPADYRNPDAGSITIAVNVHRATSPDKRIGYLLVNPGGPGGSGLAMAFAAPRGFFTDEILEHFDIVGFDPRGVGISDELVARAREGFGIDLRVVFGGGSEPEFACGGLGEQLALLASIDMPIDTPEEIAAGEAAANLCIQSMGPVGGLLHSEYVARDMDEIRKALGADQISYYGISYGSELGVWYATLFPDSVRAMAVDGARNRFPSDPDQPERVPKPEEFTRGDLSTADFEPRLEAALTACADPECPIYNDGDPVGYFMQAVAKIDLVNAAAGNHPHGGLLWGVRGLGQRGGLAWTVAGSVRTLRERRPGYSAQLRQGRVVHHGTRRKLQ